MRLKKLLEDEEYLEHKNELLLKRERLKERLEDVNHSAEKQLALTERAFTFACYVSYWFDNGTIEQKNTILKTIGSNFILKDRKLSLELKNPWLTIQEDFKDANAKKDRLEPSEILDLSGLKPIPPTTLSVPLAGRCSNFFRERHRDTNVRRPATRAGKSTLSKIRVPINLGPKKDPVYSFF